jgi:hypothetical protein
LEWGGPENAKFFKNVYEGEGKHHPAYLRRPALRRDCVRYYDAFRVLGASRIWSQVGPEPILVSEVESFLNMSGVTDPDTKLKYLRLIKQLDRVELKYLHSKTKK